MESEEGPRPIIAALKDIPWIIGRYWIDHDVSISLIGIVVHMMTSSVSLFGTYALIIAVFPDQIAKGILSIITSLCIFQSFCSGIFPSIIFNIILHLCLSSFARSFVLTNSLDIITSILCCIAIIGTSFGVQILFCHRYCLGSFPSRTPPEWFPVILDVVMKQFNEPYLLLMVLIYHYRWFGVDAESVLRAKEVRKRLSHNDKGKCS